MNILTIATHGFFSDSLIYKAAPSGSANFVGNPPEIPNVSEVNIYPLPPKTVTGFFSDSLVSNPAPSGSANFVGNPPESPKVSEVNIYPLPPKTVTGVGATKV